MNKISAFKDRPKTNTAWWAMGLGLSAVLVPPFWVFAAAVRPIIDPASVNSENTSMAPGFGGVVFALALSVSALVVGIRAFAKGERTWVLWLGLVPAILVALFWTFMIIGEFIFPH